MDRGHEYFKFDVQVLVVFVPYEWPCWPRLVVNRINLWMIN